MEPVELMGKAAAVAVTAAPVRRGAPAGRAGTGPAAVPGRWGGSCWRRGTACGRRPA